MKDASMLTDSTRSPLHRRRLAAALAVLALAALFGSACGPIKSTQRIGQAEVALERARVVEAYKKAPYEFFSARYDVHKAKEEWGYSDFEASFDYADDAKDAAESAIRKAEEDPWEDPIQGRNKTYELKPRQTISVDPEEIRQVEDFEGSEPPSGASSPEADEESSDETGADEETDEESGETDSDS
jgi:hypothetical protein